MPMTNLEDKACLFAGATAWCTLDMLHACWQVPLSEDAQEMFTMVTPEGLFTPRRVPAGVLNASGYFQATMGDLLDGYIDEICLVWVDDIVIWGETPEILLKRLLGIFGSAAGPWNFRGSPQGRFLPKGNQVVWENPLRTDGEPRPRAHPGTE